MVELKENEKVILEFLYRWIRPIRVGDLKNELNAIHSTLNSQLKNLEKDGLIEWSRYGTVCLSKKGKEIAAHLTRHHRILEQFLVEFLEMDAKEACQESEILTPLVTCNLIRRINEKITKSDFCPCGNPIPKEGICEN